MSSRKALSLLLGRLCFTVALPTLVSGLEGDLRVHDPSTIVACDGRYYVFFTGPGIPILSSEDAFTWQRSGQVFNRVPDSVKSAVPLNDGRLVWAPDVIKLNGEYYLYYSISSWGSNVSAIGLVTNPTLNAHDPKYKWTDRGLVVNSVAGENLNAIDPGVVYAPDGTLWLSYGSYIGNVQVVQLDPKTGLRIAKNSPTYIVSSASEASDIIYHDGYFYLFVNRGSCCKGKDSTYNIRMGRARAPTGPYLDRYGADMAHGGGSLFLAAEDKQIGPGHFGLLSLDGVEKFSCHDEADLSKGGRGTLCIRPLLWGSDVWPAPGEDVRAGTYQLRSLRLGTILEHAAINPQSAPPLHLGAYLTHDNQKWEVAPAGKGYYKIIESTTSNALEATTSGGVDIAAFTSAPTQLWKIDQLSNGSYRILAKGNRLALTAVTTDSKLYTVSLAPYSASDLQQWTITNP
jgi:arabinan endo-1,5-alpha-L-arabinosidase